MRLDIAERLRCPRQHAASPLIVVAQETRERELVRGFAGCPVCQLEARIERGDVFFPGAPAVATSASKATRGGDAHRERLDRLVALLGLAEPGGAVLLSGGYAELAGALVAVADVDVAIIGTSVSGDAAGVSAVRLREPLVPFSDNTFRAAALDASTGSALAADAARAVQVGGRVLGAVSIERPVLVKELARDDSEWVGEREAGPGGVVTIRRA